MSNLRSAATRSATPGDTAFSRAFPTAQALQGRYQRLVQQQCQRCEDQGMDYLTYTDDPHGAGEGLFPGGTHFHGPVQCLAPTGLDPQHRLRVYFTEPDRALVEDAIDRHEARLAHRGENA